MYHHGDDFHARAGQGLARSALAARALFSGVLSRAEAARAALTMAKAFYEFFFLCISMYQ